MPLSDFTFERANIRDNIVYGFTGDGMNWLHLAFSVGDDLLQILIA